MLKKFLDDDSGATAIEYGLIVAVLSLVMTTMLGSGATQTAMAADTCQEGMFCAWADDHYRGAVHHLDPTTAPLEHCIGLPRELEASSFVNHTGHPVTVYQDGRCATQAEFKTYPSGTYVPENSYVARAVKIWRH